MSAAMGEVERRREIQVAYNKANDITPRTVIKPVRDSIEAIYEMDYVELDGRGEESSVAEEEARWDPERLRGEVEKTRADMLRAAQELRFEEAATLRDRLEHLEELELSR